MGCLIGSNTWGDCAITFDLELRSHLTLGQGHSDFEVLCLVIELN